MPSVEAVFVGTDEQFFNAMGEMAKKKGVVGVLARESLIRLSESHNEALELAAKICENRAHINHINGNPDGGMLNDAFAIRASKK